MHLTIRLHGGWALVVAGTVATVLPAPEVPSYVERLRAAAREPAAGPGGDDLTSKAPTAE